MKILCLKITFLLLLLFEMLFWISMLHPSGTRPIPSIPTAFYLNHQKPQHRILRFLLIWQKNFYQQIPWNYFYRQFPEIIIFWKTIWTRFTVTVFFRKQKKACAHTWTCPTLLPEGFSPAGISMKPFPSLPTKEITRTRIQRALLHMLLHIQSVPAQIPYARVLGFRKNSSALLGKIKKCGSIPLLTRLPDAAAVLKNAPQAMDLLNKTTFASNLYESILAQKNSVSYVHEYRQQIIIV